MIGVWDPEGVEKRAIHQLVDFEGKRVFEIGCGEGRMTWLYAHEAASVLAFDPKAPAINIARDKTPPELKSRIDFRTGGVMDIDLSQGVYDTGIFAWSI
ncbi:MAG: methyltransferase domain-containing protein [Chloroflexi bacterium]|nr:methyltransferase domain-containing protein [Chloroflexota bacterium]